MWTLYSNLVFLPHLKGVSCSIFVFPVGLRDLLALSCMMSPFSLFLPVCQVSCLKGGIQDIETRLASVLPLNSLISVSIPTFMWFLESRSIPSVPWTHLSDWLPLWFLGAAFGSYGIISRTWICCWEILFAVYNNILKFWYSPAFAVPFLHYTLELTDNGNKLDLSSVFVVTLRGTHINATSLKTSHSVNFVKVIFSNHIH